ncbi:MAG: hypothetical protein J0L75_06965 [Spirochaetes bacterium]|nr:hypothetical protein [Spirochaetota bacterium]
MDKLSALIALALFLASCRATYSTEPGYTNRPTLAAGTTTIVFAAPLSANQAGCGQYTRVGGAGPAPYSNYVRLAHSNFHETSDVTWHSYYKTNDSSRVFSVDYHVDMANPGLIVPAEGFCDLDPRYWASFAVEVTNACQCDGAPRTAIVNYPVVSNVLVIRN